MTKRLTFREARLISEPIVYALCDRGGVFYVGKTAVPAKRFYQHAAGAPRNPRLHQRLMMSGGEVRVEVLHRSPADIDAAEQAEILSRPALLNIVGIDRPFGSFPAPVEIDRPWVSGRERPPSAWARLRTGPDRELDKIIDGMTPARRCAYELNLLASLDPYIQRRFSRWLALTGPKMRAALEAA